jgi:hypothetical protein
MNRLRGLGLGIVAGLLLTRVAGASDNWRFPVGLSYVDGFSEVVSYYEDNHDVDAGGFVPIGLSFTPYYQFDHGSRIGFDLGPAGLILGDVTYWDVPIALTYGLTILPDASWSPYVRGGFKYHFVGGDDVQDSTPGLFGAVGVEFFRQKAVGLQFEVGYDSSEVTMEDDGSIGGWSSRRQRGETTVNPGGLLVSIRAVL